MQQPNSGRGAAAHAIVSSKRPEAGLRPWRLAPDCFEAGIAAAVPAIELILGRVLHVVVLVVVLSYPERSCLQDRGHDRLREALRVRERLFGPLSQSLLLDIMGKDRGAVGCAPIAELTTWVERIDVAPEHVQQLVVR